MDITVKYNDQTISPTPLVQQSYQFLDFGKRWGNILQIQLDGLLTGINTTGSLTGLSNLFSGQFGTLTVTEGASVMYSWDNLNVDEIVVPENHYYTQSFAPYSVKMRRYNVPSGVIDPINEYAFTQGEDGVVTVSHRISAKGVKNTTGGFLNAINFVRSLTGKNPFNPIFMPSGQNVLMSLSENINRIENVYGVQEIYKYSTGSSANYLETFTVNITDDFNAEYLTLETNLRLQGSPIHNNMISMESSVGSTFNAYSRLNSIGINTGSLMRNAFSVNRDSGAAMVEVKQSFISGYSVGDLAGIFDYHVTLDYDLIMPKQGWKLEGEFVCRGPLDYKLQQLAAFKATNSPNWSNYFSGLIVTSPLYSDYSLSQVWSHDTVEIRENTGMAQFRASYAFVENAAHPRTQNAKYVVDVNPSKWQFDSIPSANIEGHYVVQDMQMRTQGRLSFNIDCESNNPVLAAPVLSGYLNQLQVIYLSPNNNSSLIVENLTTGFFDASYNREWLGIDLISSGTLKTKVVGSTLANYTRKKGYQFGF
jgi:hypothetical protein